MRTSGYSNAFTDLFKNNSPDYAVGLNLTIPLRNRGAQADQIRSQLEYRQAQLHLQQLQNQIGIEVRNAQFALLQNRSRVEAARKARDLAQQTFDVEQKKKALGASTSNLVLQADRDLAQAESNFVAAMSTYEKSMRGAGPRHRPDAGPRRHRNRRGGARRGAADPPLLGSGSEEGFCP